MADDFLFLGLENGVDEGQITQIHVTNGDSIKKGQKLFELEADKLSQAITAQHDGKIKQINFKIGDIIKKGAVFATNSVVNSNETIMVNTVEKTATQQSNDVVLPSSSNLKKTDVNVMSATESKTVVNNLAPKLVLSSPLARRIAKQMGIDITTVKGTGPNGRVLKMDLMNQQQNLKNTSELKKHKASVVETDELIKKVKMTPTRKAIAQAMTISKSTIPHTTLMITVNVTALVQLRSQLKKTIVKPEFKLTYMPFFIKAIAMGLKEFPIMNARLDLENFEIIYQNYYHLGIAVDTEQGLIVPLMKVLEQQDIFSVANAYNEVIMKVKNKKLTAADMKMGTFTITNYGSLGLDFGTPIINYPQAAILGIGAIKKTPVVDENNNIVVNDILPLSISIDHRIIDGADAGRFLGYLKKILESPTSLLISF